MNGWKKWILAGGLLLILQPQQVIYAQEIQFTGDKCPLPVAVSPGENSVIKQVRKIDILGRVSEEWNAVILGNQVGYVSTEDLETLIPKLDLETLPAAWDMTDYAVGSSGDGAAAIQEQLIELEYLTGTADGIYGNGTAGAVSDFQSACNLEATGTADAVTQWLLQKKTQKENEEPLKLEYPPVFHVEEKFAAFYQKTDIDLTAFLDPSWKLEYDEYRGIGTLAMKPELVLGSMETGSSAIEKLSAETYLELSVISDEEGKVTMQPIICIRTRGAFRPYIKNLYLKTGEDVYELPVAEQKSSIENTDVLEISKITLISDAGNALKAADENSIILLAEGQNQDFQIPFTGDITQEKTFFETCEQAGIFEN